MSDSVNSSVQDAWYTYKGFQDDVVLSSNVQLSRNLANFPFPSKLHGRDGSRVQSIVFDAFNKLEDSEHYQAISVSNLDSLGSKILRERGFFGSASDKDINTENSGIILRTDGYISCTVNIIDHVRISSFSSGLDFDNVLNNSQGVDSQLQNYVQFAASYDFGYLTSSVMEAGSGIRLSIRTHLPSLSMLGCIKDTSEEMYKEGIVCSAPFGAGEFNSSLGSYYDFSLINCQSGSEFDQTASIVSVGKRLIEKERSARQECMRRFPSEIRNNLFRSLAIARSSLFISARDAINVIHCVKWGTDLEIIKGISDSELHALLYRIQEGHLEYVLKNGTFEFEEDITNTSRKIERLRALILQEAFEDINIAL
ncbi:MAG: hypothetical protein K6G00_09045 [Treponema sp.]|nr:hypothetical protein [Treponema sp.]